MNNFPAMTEAQRQELIGRLQIYIRFAETAIKAGLATEEDVFNLDVRKIALAALAVMSAPALRVPDGWKLVPIEPTDDMVIRGFESAPDEVLSDADVWEAFNAMSGCQQAAHKARLCYAAMLAAAPEA